jgi:hypothetical protein
MCCATFFQSSFFTSELNSFEGLHHANRSLENEGLLLITLGFFWLSEGDE